MLYLRIYFKDGFSQSDITTGDEISMAEIFEGIKNCTGLFTINGPGITHIIDMSKVDHWEAVFFTPPVVKPLCSAI